jgi:lauroyl/myristoyl acyltransferase
MDALLYYPARAVVAVVQALPLRLVARIGRGLGALAYVLDARHRRVAIKNLTHCFGREKSPAEIIALAKEIYRRIGENFASAVKTAGMTFEELNAHVTYAVPPEFKTPPGVTPRSVVVAIGHFGNFELYVRLGQFCPGFQGATTYRALRQPAFTRLLQELREQSGCLFFERRFDADKLKAAMNRPGIMLGLLCDQRGKHSHDLPLLGVPTPTSTAVAVFALRYKCPLHPGICYRTGLAQWHIEVGAEIPTQENGVVRSPEAIMRDVNEAFTVAIRRDPANWFWVHDRWKGSRTEATKPSGE